MEIWKNVQKHLPDWSSTNTGKKTAEHEQEAGAAETSTTSTDKENLWQSVQKHLPGVPDWLQSGSEKKTAKQESGTTTPDISDIWKNVQKHLSDLPDWLPTGSRKKTAGDETKTINPEQENTDTADNGTARPAQTRADTTAAESPKATGDSHLQLATESLRQLLEDSRIPNNVRTMLNEDYSQVQRMLDKLEHGHIHIAVFGRVSVGKSSLLNALLGKEAFSVSVLHGETKQSDIRNWEEYEDGGLFLIDTPGINEVDGEAREELAHEVAERSDMVLFVVDSDLTDVEFRALKTITAGHRPVLLVVNKADRYTEKEQRQLRSVIRERTHGTVAPENIVFTTAQATRQTVIMVDEDGNETESVRSRPTDIIALKTRLWDILESEGKTLAALNASLFAGNLSTEVGQRILEVKRELGAQTIRMYCIGKGVAVALNPIPVADLVAAAAIDAGMVMHLSRLYGLPMSKSEAGELISTIIGQMIVLIGTTWAINLLSSALKLGTGGLSTVLTATTQGAVAWYSTLVVGSVAERWLANGKSWGDAGPKLAVQQILDSLDRDSVVAEARDEILSYMRKTIKG